MTDRYKNTPDVPGEDSRRGKERPDEQKDDKKKDDDEDEEDEGKGQNANQDTTTEVVTEEPVEEEKADQVGSSPRKTHSSLAFILLLIIVSVTTNIQCLTN